MLYSAIREACLDPSPWRERAYHASFLIAAAVLAVTGLAGIGRSAVTTRRLPGLAQDPLFEGRRLAALGRHAEAREEFLRTLAVNPWDVALNEDVGKALLLSDDPENALIVFQRARAQRPRSARIHAWIGRALLLQGRPDEAEEAVRIALSLGPQDAGALQVVGDLLIDRDLYPQAIDILRRSVAADPTLGSAHNSLGVALVLAGRPLEAVQAFEAALRLDPTLGPDNRDRARAAARQAGARP